MINEKMNAVPVPVFVKHHHHLLHCFSSHLSISLFLIFHSHTYNIEEDSAAIESPTNAYPHNEGSHSSHAPCLSIRILFGLFFCLSAVMIIIACARIFVCIKCKTSFLSSNIAAPLAQTSAKEMQRPKKHICNLPHAKQIEGVFLFKGQRARGC